MITETQMKTLLDIKDAIDSLDSITEILLGRSEAVAYDNGALGKLAKIYDLIVDLSTLDTPKTGPEDDIYDSPVMQILENKHLTNAEKARKLLGK